MVRQPSTPPEPAASLRLVAGIVPSYWFGELLRLPAEPLPFLIVAAAAILTHLGWGVILFRLFVRRAG